MSTKIEWVRNPDGTAGETWNPVTGCSKLSPGCKNCYAERMDRRQMMPGRKDGFRVWAVFNAEYNVRLHPERLGQPLKWKRPRRVFVNSMSDLFHERVPDEFICDVFEVMEKAKQHIFQVLTKRPERMCDLITGEKFISGIGPPANIWWGVSAEDQKTFDERVRWVLQTPAAVRWVSLEPLLGPIDASAALWPTCWEQHGHEGECFEGPALDWVIVGGESGPGARPMNPDWVRAIRDQCQAAGVPFLFKQWGAWAPDCLCATKRPHRTIERPNGKLGVMFRCGKKAAGRVLDGRIWNEFPEVS